MLLGFGIADRITGTLQFTVEPENQNFSKTNFLRVMSTPFSYSKGSGLYLAAMYTQNKLKLIKCSIWRPDKPKISTFTGADLKKVNFWNRKLFVRSNRSRVLHRIWFYPTAIYPRNKINLVRCSIWRSDDPKASIFSGADICHFWKNNFFCVIPPSPETPQALLCHPVLFIPQTEKKYLGSPIADRISQSLQFIVEPEYHNFSRTNILRASPPPSSYSIDSALSSSSIDSIFSTEKQHRCCISWPDNPKISTFAGADLRTGQILENFFRRIQSLPRYSISSAFFPHCYLFPKQTKLAQGFQSLIG